jgi:hypothetical protein
MPEQFDQEIWIEKFKDISQDDIFCEYDSQVQKFEQLFGRLPTHIDSHHYASSYPSTFPAGSMTLGGNVSVVGDIASATSITTNGKPEINGSGSSPEITDKHGTIIGGTSDDPDRYTFTWDSFLKLEDYIVHAVTWDFSTPLSSYPDGTILYVPGNIKITETSPLNLCIIATGDISVTAQANLTQPGTYPTLVSRDGSIKLAGGATVDGLIAAMSSSGSVQTTGGGNTPVNINGSVITGGDFKDAGNWAINYAPITLLPPGEYASEDNVVVVAWKD